MEQRFKIISFSRINFSTNFSHRPLKKRKVYKYTIRELHIENWDVLTRHVKSLKTSSSGVTNNNKYVYDYYQHQT